MANTGSGSLATILFLFVFPAALRKGRTLPVFLSLRVSIFTCRSGSRTFVFSPPLPVRPIHIRVRRSAAASFCWEIVRSPGCISLCWPLLSKIKVGNSEFIFKKRSVVSVRVLLVGARKRASRTHHFARLTVTNHHSCQLLNAANSSVCSVLLLLLLVLLLKWPSWLLKSLSHRFTCSLCARPLYFFVPLLSGCCKSAEKHTAVR